MSCASANLPRYYLRLQLHTLRLLVWRCLAKARLLLPLLLLHHLFLLHLLLLLHRHLLFLLLLLRLLFCAFFFYSSRSSSSSPSSSSSFAPSSCSYVGCGTITVVRAGESRPAVSVPRGLDREDPGWAESSPAAQGSRQTDGEV